MPETKTALVSSEPNVALVDAERQWKIPLCTHGLPWMNFCSAWGAGAKLPHAEPLEAARAVLAALLMWGVSSPPNSPAWKEGRAWLWLLRSAGASLPGSQHVATAGWWSQHWHRHFQEHSL